MWCCIGQSISLFMVEFERTFTNAGKRICENIFNILFVHVTIYLCLIPLLPLLNTARILRSFRECLCVLFGVDVQNCENVTKAAMECGSNENINAQVKLVKVCQHNHRYIWSVVWDNWPWIWILFQGNGSSGRRWLLFTVTLHILRLLP